MKYALTFLAALSLHLPAARAEKLPQWLKILPENTVGYIAIKSAPELMADWGKSGYGRMMEDAEVQKWMAPMYQQGEAVWDRELKKNTGKDLHDNLQHLQGSALMVFAADSAKDFENSEHGNPFIMVMEVGDQQAKVEELLVKKVTEDLAGHKAWRKVIKDVDGVPLHILAHSEAADAPWSGAYAFVDGVLVIGDKPALIERFIPALKAGGGEGPAVVSSHLTRHARYTDGTSDISLYANGEVLMKWLAGGLAETMKNGKSPIPLEPKVIFDLLGIHEFQSLGVAIDVTDAQSRMDVTLLHPEKPSGILSLLRGSSTEVSLPAFIPADVLSAQVSRQSLGEVWDGLLGMVNKLGPVALMATMQIGALEQQMGFKIKDDLFGSLADEFVQISDGTSTTQSQVIGIKVKDRAKLEAALGGLKSLLGNGFGAAFAESNYLGYTVVTYKVAQPAAASAASSQIGYCLTDDYLLFNTGGQDLLKKVLGRMKEPSGPSLWDSPRTQELISMLPKGYNGVGTSDASRQLLMILDAMEAVQKQSAGKKKSASSAKKGGQNPKTETAAESKPKSAETWFDPAARPSVETFKKYLGTEVNGTYSHPEAIHFRILSKPVE